MKVLLNVLLFPIKLSAWLTKTLGRMVVGIVGVAFMTIGLFLWFSLDLPLVGIPVMLVGLLLAAKAIF